MYYIYLLFCCKCVSKKNKFILVVDGKTELYFFGLGNLENQHTE